MAYRSPPMKQEMRAHWRKKPDDIWHMYIYSYRDYIAQVSACGAIVASGRDEVAYYHPKDHECCPMCVKARNRIKESTKHDGGLLGN